MLWKLSVSTCSSVRKSSRLTTDCMYTFKKSHSFRPPFLYIVYTSKPYLHALTYSNHIHSAVTFHSFASVSSFLFSPLFFSHLHPSGYKCIVRAHTHKKERLVKVSFGLVQLLLVNYLSFFVCVQCSDSQLCKSIYVSEQHPCDVRVFPPRTLIASSVLSDHVIFITCHVTCCNLFRSVFFL